jgi:5'-phosphate synthase pdxT subunit|tara:strand:- start:292 stop:903 length:612 start_codon:yes stop_codon:yes gene_type:complete
VIKVGILELQGDFELHHNILRELGYTSFSVKESTDLENLDGLIIPGGESTTMSLLIDSFNLRKSILDFSKENPILGTCAGLILMARAIEDESKVNPLGILDIEVSRNAYGRQIMSRKENITIESDSKTFDMELTLIRAPKILKINKSINVIAEIDNSPAAVFDGRHMGLSFHPELNGVTFFHEMLFSSSNTLNFKNSESINAA